MNKWLVIVLTLVAVIAALGIGIRNYMGLDKQNIPPIVDTNVSNLSEIDPNELVSDYKVETVTENLNIPWSMVFTSNDRILVTERTGAVRVVVAGKLQSKPLMILPVKVGGEAGLMGMTADPNYKDNKLIYVCYSYESSQGLKNRVVKFEDYGDRTENLKTVIENLPSAQFHAGCKVKFGPDDKLYVTVGDAGEKELVQDKNYLGGKILRLNPDGTVPGDNPFPGSAVFAYGFRNSQGMSWDDRGQLWTTDHGPSGFDGPGGGDEINLVKKGGNYGWDVVSHDKNQSGMEAAKQVYTPAVAPSGLIFYSEDTLPMFKGSVIFAALKGEGLYQLFLNDDGTSIRTWKKLDKVKVGRVRDITVGPDGLIYFTTSNRDGRGKVQTGDDKIYRLVPEKLK